MSLWRFNSTFVHCHQALQLAVKRRFEDADEPVANGMDQEENSAVNSEQPENDSSIANNTTTTGPGEEVRRHKRIRVIANVNCMSLVLNTVTL